MATTDQTAELAHARRLLADECFDDASTIIDQFLDNQTDPRHRAEALALRVSAMAWSGSSTPITAALEEAFEANKVVPDMSVRGELHALAALNSLRSDSFDRCAAHLVWGSRALASVELTHSTTAWAWHDLALAYSHIGFHDHALAAIDKARTVAGDIGLNKIMFAAPGIPLRQSIDYDHHGDTDRARGILREIATTYDRHKLSGELDHARPSDLGLFGYAIARWMALDASGHDDLFQDAPSLIDRLQLSSMGREFHALGLTCLAIAHHRPLEAVARLDTLQLREETFHHAEASRLQALAYMAIGDHGGAYRADRMAFKSVSARFHRLRDLFIEAVTARMDSDELRRNVAGYTPSGGADDLTGLPDHRQLEAHLEKILSRNEPILLGICDLDGFPEISAKYGRSSGELVTQRVAGVLNRVMRHGDFIARLADHQFAVVLPIAARPEIHEISRRIVAAMGEEDWNGLVPGSRIGVTLGWAGAQAKQTFTSSHEAIREATEAIAQTRHQH